MSEQITPVPPAEIEVAGWSALVGITHYDEVWSAWLHGSVAAIDQGESLLLIVPVGVLTPNAVSLALRLYRLGEVKVLAEDAAA